MQIEINGNYGYVLLVNIALAFVLAWLGTNVGKARKKYNVPYPTMYLDPAHKDAMAFNCVQRAHQNALESFPQFIFAMLIGGLVFPVTCAIFGIIWGVGRIVYALGYYSGDPKKRNRGIFQYIGFLGVLNINIYIALQLLGVV